MKEAYIIMWKFNRKYESWDSYSEKTVLYNMEQIESLVMSQSKDIDNQQRKNHGIYNGKMSVEIVDSENSPYKNTTNKTKYGKVIAVRFDIRCVIESSFTNVDGKEVLMYSKVKELDEFN